MEKPTFFDKFIDGFVNIFGSKTHFVLATVGAIGVVILLFTQGYKQWLLSTGLASNNYESAIEYFLAVATLYQAAKITIKQSQQSKHLQESLDNDVQMEKNLTELLVKNNELTQEVHDFMLKNEKTK